MLPDVRRETEDRQQRRASGRSRRDVGSIAHFLQRASRLAGPTQCAHAAAMFVVTEAEAAAIRAVYQQRGEFSAAVELRRRFPGITDNAQARECARTIAGWKPLRR